MLQGPHLEKLRQFRAEYHLVDVLRWRAKFDDVGFSPILGVKRTRHPRLWRAAPDILGGRSRTPLRPPTPSVRQRLTPPPPSGVSSFRGSCQCPNPRSPRSPSNVRIL